MPSYTKYSVNVYEDGSKFWYLNGKRHRDDGPAVDEQPNGTKYWFLNGDLHRTDGPAIEYATGSKFWYLNGELHREDGPAVECADGEKLWFLNGKKITEEEHARRTQPAKELSVAEIEKLLGYRIKIVKDSPNTSSD